MRQSILGVLLLAFVLTASAQTFTGTNAPGKYTEFPLTVSTGATNLALTLGGTGAAYSYLLVKKDSSPSDTSYDFSSKLNGTTNALYLEQSEVAPGTYYIRVVTPVGASQGHRFTLVCEANRTDLGTATTPVTKALSGPLSGTATGLLAINGWKYFRVELTTNTSWMARVDATNQMAPSLFIASGQIPTTANSLANCVGQTNGLLAFLSTDPAGTAGVYYFGLSAANLASRIPYSFQVQTVGLPALSWDPGTVDSGTLVYTNLSGADAYYFFHILTANPAYGAWRTVLRTLTNDANLYLSQGALPTPTTAKFKSELPGSDGFVLALNSDFQPSQDWYILVRAKVASQWTLLSGSPFVTDLGTVAADGSSGSGTMAVGPEGIRFFRATAPSGMLAWRLWLNGLTNSILLKQTAVPLPKSGGFDLSQAGQMLVVPPYLAASQYLIGVPGTNDALINLDSRQQPISNFLYNSVTNAVVAGFGYATYAVQVPNQQIAWQLTMSSTSGNPYMAVRENQVPNENNNGAASELNSPQTNNITLVPPPTTSLPGLGSGTFYITVYGTNQYQFTLQSGPAAITDINYSGVVTNDDPGRVGWRIYRVQNLAQQAGTLGWNLLVTNFSPGTRVALRRASAPGVWSYRVNSPGLTLANYYDQVDISQSLQQPGHQADVWYVGVYNPTNALGAFTLITGELLATGLSEGAPLTQTNIPNGRWGFYKVQLLPSDVLGTNAVVGWDVRLTNVISGSPQLVVCRDLLPVSLSTTLLTGGSTWPSGSQWAAGGDWTGLANSSDGTTNETGRILAMGVGQPLVPGTYYIGVLNQSADTNQLNYQIVSRWIGAGHSIPVPTLDWNNGALTNSLPPREAAYYRVVVPANAPSWKVRLANQTAETMLIATANTLPTVFSQKQMEKTGPEQYLRLPQPGTNYLVAGTNYLTVIGEGANPRTTSIGAGASSFVLQSLGPLPVANLGVLTAGTNLVVNNNLAGGESAAYQFSADLSVLGFWVTLSNTLGHPCIVERLGPALPDPGFGSGSVATDAYGNEGGETSYAAASYYAVETSGNYSSVSLMIKARAYLGVWLDAAYTLQVTPILPSPLAYDAGTNVITNALEDTFFAVDVPTNAAGWDLRLTNVTSGNPLLLVAREALPVPQTTPPTSVGFNPSPFAADNWPNGSALWVAGSDWTQRNYTPAGASDLGQILAMGRGRPLQAGRYYVAVKSGNGLPVNGTLLSRGIGSAFSIPVTDLLFAGGQVTQPLLTALEAAYFRVTITNPVASWKVSLSSPTSESLLIVLKDSLPNVGALSSSTITNSGGRKMQQIGDEQFLLLPELGQTNLTPGTYYLAVVGEGELVTSASAIGSGGGGFTVTSIGEAPINNLGVFTNSDVRVTNSLSAGETAIYQFNFKTQSLGVGISLENTTGDPTMVLGMGARIPDPSIAGGGFSADTYGTEGGDSPAYGVSTNLITLVNPTNGLYSLVVKARANTPPLGPDQTAADASFVLHLSPLSTQSNQVTMLHFEDTNAVPLQAPNTWRYFQITVPPDAAGWDLRLINVSNGLPRLVVRRGSWPTNFNNWSSAGNYTTWPSNNQMAASLDATGMGQSVNDGTVDETGRSLFMSMNHPLQPDVYFIGVCNSATSTNMTYTLQTRGVGANYTIPLSDLRLTGATTNLGLAPREIAYYRVVVPSNTPNWKLVLQPTIGSCLLAVLRDALPNVDTLNVGDTSGSLLNGKCMKNPGNQYFIQLPMNGTNTIPAGTNYLAVVSRGINPTANQVGAGNCSFALASIGSMTPVNLGLVTPEDLVYPETLGLGGGESKPYQFTVPDGVQAVQVSLDSRVGNPTIVALTNANLPDPGAAVTGLSQDTYGNEGGYPPSFGAASIVTMPSIAAGTYSLMVKARAVSGSYSGAAYTVRVRQLLVPELNFSDDLNTNGLSNSFSGSLEDGERAFFMVNIPATSKGQPVIGWRLDVSQKSGQAYMRAARGFLPNDANAAVEMPFAIDEAIIAPPYLTNGVWFVEVKAIGATVFTLTSSPLLLTQPVWVMPAPGQATATPGLTPPTFGDSTVDTNGAAIGNSSLPPGKMDYYAVWIPGTNLGLLRTELVAISGNSTLYLRAGAAPTLSHSASGLSGNLYDRSVTAGSSQTQRANWVPVDGKTATELQPGLWYLAVGAPTNSQVSYQLRVSTGNVTLLPPQGSGVANQFVNGGDWGYYRVPMPTGLPLTFSITFGHDSGNTVLYLRDTVPPGNGVGSSDVRDWYTDNKNGYGTAYLNNLAPGTYQFTAPPVRPGQDLYLGMLAKNDSTFHLSIATNGAPAQDPTVVPFYGGTATNLIDGFSSAIFRVDVPPEATRWIHTSVHSTNLQVLLEQGTLPTRSFNHWFSPAASTNSGCNNLLVGSWNAALRAYNPPSWPWAPGQSYYLVVTNATALPQSFALMMNGQSAATDLDSSGSGLPVAWEYRYFNTTGINPLADADSDGVNNYQEYLDGTDPTNPNSFLARLYVTTGDGSVLANPNTNVFSLGSTVTLTAVPASNYAFIRWTGASASTANPLALMMDSAKHISAIFELAGDNFSTALPIAGASWTTSHSNVNFTKEPGEPNHASNPGGASIWWQWTAPASGSATLSTAGSTFDTLLAVYTGNSVGNLTAVGSDHDSGTNYSRVTFNALQNTTYAIAVDGYNDGTIIDQGLVSLTLALANSSNSIIRPFLLKPRLVANTLQFVLMGEASQAYSVQYSTDMVTWYPLTNLTTAADGTALITDSSAPTAKARFYRVSSP